ncbi:MAG: hypothetical protein ACP5RP_00090 [Candidatus Micrarchaeia archaeon]
MNSKITAIAGLIIILVVVGLAILILKPSKPLQSTNGGITTTVKTGASNSTPIFNRSNFTQLVVQITDPPLVPNGTQKLIVKYNYITVTGTDSNISSTNSTLGEDILNNGTINLMNLTSMAETVGVANISKNFKIKAIIINLKSANITIDNNTYELTLPSNVLEINASNISKNNTIIVLDMHPTVLQIYTSGNNTYYTMVPSVAVAGFERSEFNNSVMHLGAVTKLSVNVKKALKMEMANISISGVELQVSGNRTYLAVSIKNNGNKNVRLKHVLLYGYMEMKFPIMPDAIQQSISLGIKTNGYISTNIITVGANTVLNSSLKQISQNITGNAGIKGNSRIIFNGSDFRFGSLTNSTENRTILNELNITSENGSYETSIADFMNSKFARDVLPSINYSERDSGKVWRIFANVKNFYNRNHNTLNFLVSGNGSMYLPFDMEELENDTGYMLKPNSSVTLWFNGTIQYGNEKHIIPLQNANNSSSAGTVIQRFEHGITIVPLVNQTYSVRVSGNRGAVATANVVAV